MKKRILIVAFIFSLISCSQKESIKESVIQQKEILSKKEINSIIKKEIENTGDFQWSKQDTHVILSALSHGNNILTIGYGSAKNDFTRSSSSENIKKHIISLVNKNEEKLSKSTNKVYSNDHINIIDIKVNKEETLLALMNDPSVRYIEPADYNFNENNQIRSSKGCDRSQKDIKEADYRIITPNAKVPWSFDKHKIPEAWEYSTGKNITIAIIDTGLSPEQKLMNESFNSGDSSERTVQKYGTFVDSWLPWSNNYDGVNDKCGHGTSMASVATAPRNNSNLPMGVAYNANLISYRAVEDVVIDDYHEKRGISEALTALANRNDVKIISMSLGYPFSIGRVKDAIRYAYRKGKMILAAGGTSTAYTTWYGVIFPASMEETVAVTGVKENIYEKCDDCHTGSKIDFTIQMQRTNGTSNNIPILSYYNDNSDYEGGSSVATATTAGIAALVWSKNPNWTREQVLQKIKKSSDFYPAKHPEFGYGNINVLKAVQ